MSIVLVGPSLSQRGGIVSVIQALRGFLSSKNIQVDVISTTTDGGTIRKILTFMHSWLSVVRICLLNNKSIVHLHMSSGGSCLRKSILGLTCWLFKTNYIIHLHSGRFDTFYTQELNRSSKSFVNFVFRKADNIIVLSQAMKTWLDNTIQPRKVNIIFNGVPSCITPEKSAESPTVLFLGRLCTNKGTGELISAMREVIKVVPDAILELGGDGDIESYKQQASDMPNIKFLGWINDDARKEAFARASIYCLPSWSEGLPMSVLEAMSAGLPVVSTPVGGIPEAVEHGKTGLLIKPGDVKGLADALTCLLLDTSLATGMGDKGQAIHRKRFSAESMGESCLEVYASCMKK